jgi:dipeptidyl aminopeptidase/acylaminoacyl peptidase
LFAEHQRRQAEEQTTLAISRELAAQASLARASPEDGLVRSTLLAIESLRRRPTLEGQTALMADVPLLRHRIARLAHDGVVAAVAFSPNGTRLATASGDQTARLWEVATGRELARLAHDGSVTAVAFSPDGTRLATASMDSTARLWEVATGRELGRLAHHGVVLAVAFSPDGTRLATASLDKTARLWEAAGRQLARLAIYGEVSDVAFSPDGAMLATAGPGPRARLWLCRTEDLIAAACRCLERNLTRDEWHQYLGEAPYHATCPDLPLPGASQ